MDKETLNIRQLVIPRGCYEDRQSRFRPELLVAAQKRRDDINYRFWYWKIKPREDAVKIGFEHAVQDALTYRGHDSYVASMLEGREADTQLEKSEMFEQALARLRMGKYVLATSNRLAKGVLQYGLPARGGNFSVTLEKKILTGMRNYDAQFNGVVLDINSPELAGYASLSGIDKIQIIDGVIESLLGAKLLEEKYPPEDRYRLHTQKEFDSATNWLFFGRKTGG